MQSVEFLRSTVDSFRHSDGHVDGRMLTVVISSMAQMKELTVDSQDVEDFGRRSRREAGDEPILLGAGIANA